MKNTIVVPLLSQPGIQRDGTPFLSEHYIDGQWCRFYMGMPRKIGGFQLIDPGNTEIIRTLFNVPMPNAVDCYMGRNSTLVYNTFDFNGNGGGEIDRTPAGYVPDVHGNNVWTMDLFTNTTNPDASNAFIVAHVAPNAMDSSSTVDGAIYYGDINLDTPLTRIVDANNNPVVASGGIVFASPIMIAYGNDGFLQWSNPGQINNWPVGESNNIVIANTKIIKAYRTRGSTAPQLLCWTLNSLLSVTYTVLATVATFVPTTIQDNITVMSPNSIVEYDQQFFWIGIDQFYFFNGLVQKLPNTMSSDWFFQNVNLTQRAKIWGMAVPRYKEIWWFYPRGSATECSDVIIYNVELQVWYDSVLGRSSGLSSNIFPFPMMSDSQIIQTESRGGYINTYGLWKHEYGTDKEYDQNILAIDSFYETHIYTLFNKDPNNNRLMRTRRIEPDFVQTGDMTVTVNNRMFASGPIISEGPYLFDGNTPKIDDVNSQGRLVSFVFESNVAGGYYQGGKTLLGYDVGDVQP